MIINSTYKILDILNFKWDLGLNPAVCITFIGKFSINLMFLLYNIQLVSNKEVF